MNQKLFWRLYLSLAIGTVALVWIVSSLSLLLESEMSKIAPHHKQELLQFAAQAQAALDSDDKQAASQWVLALQRRDGVFADIVRIEQQSLVNLPPETHQELNAYMGRGLEWPIHLHHPNPIIEIPLQSPAAMLILELPQRMRPGQLWGLVKFSLQTLSPLLLMIVLSLLLYRYFMQPLRQLELATQKFSQGEYSVRVLPLLKGRTDELAKLACTFDQMASKTGSLIEMQRHLINDLSHELRTPLQRLSLAVSSRQPEREARILREAELMKQLVEDTLSLAWLDNSQISPSLEPIDLEALLSVIIEDAHFEYPDRLIDFTSTGATCLVMANQRCLFQACENVIRNALKHTPGAAKVTIEILHHHSQTSIQVIDQGPGVPTHLLQDIFKPFFRVDKARDRDSGGFGLGLALAKRQLALIGATIEAQSLNTGLQIHIGKLQRIDSTSATRAEM